MLSFIMVTWFIWARFIVDRLPKFVPFNLTLLTLSLLIFTCIIYIIILKQLLRPRVSILVQILTAIMQKMSAPVYTLDEAIRSNLLVRKIMYKIVSQLSFHTVLYNCYEYYRIWNFTPRLLLLFIFYADVFYFHKLDLFYSFLFLSAIPLIGRYLYHLMGYLYESEVQYLEQWYEVRLIPTDPEDKEDLAYVHSSGYGFWDWIPIRYYLIVIRAESELIKYECGITRQLADKYYPDRPMFVDKGKRRKDYDDITEEDYAVMSAEFEKAMPAVINLYLLVDDYTMTLKSKGYSSKIKRMNLIIFSLFLIAWVYILMVSLPTFMLTANEIEYICKFQERWEPFSSILI